MAEAGVRTKGQNQVYPKKSGHPNSWEIRSHLFSVSRPFRIHLILALCAASGLASAMIFVDYQFLLQYVSD